jgi:uncharacterized protein (DUF362 family)
MTVAKLQNYLDELLAEDRKFDAEVVATFKKIAGDWFGVSEAEWKFLAEKVLGEQGPRFADEAARREMGRFLVQPVKSGGSPWEPFLKILDSIPGLANLLIEANLGQWWQTFKDGKAPPEVIQKVRQEARKINFFGTVSLAKIDPQSTQVAEIEAAMRKTIEAIGGFDFLSQPPEGKASNAHTILIKAGVNWGQFLYPTVTSHESVYALTRMCFQEAEKRGASVEVIVGDESGIEIVLWGGTTMDNFEHTGILQAAVRAGLERAASLQATQPDKFAGARDLLKLEHEGKKVTFDSKDGPSVKMIEMAQQAGVRVVAFDQVARQQVFIPGARHFPEGIPVPKIVAEDVTDIINLPKPPGRHMIMGNSGLSGALKNHVGLLAGENRSPGLHGLSDRYPPPGEGQTKESHLETLKARRQALREDKSGQAARQFAMDVMFNWDNFAPALPFHEKIVELYLAFAEKERFSVADMRLTVSSIGPDLGDFIDIGAVIAAKDPTTLDVLAGALLKRAYGKTGNTFDALMPGGDTLLEYLVGKTWLQNGTPFDLMSHIAANSYGVGPIDFAHINLKGAENSGFSPKEIEAITSHLR